VPDDVDDDVAFGEEDAPVAAGAPPVSDAVPVASVSPVASDAVSPVVEETTLADAHDDDTAADDLPPARGEIPELLPADDIDETPSSTADPVAVDTVEAADVHGADAEAPDLEAPDVVDHHAAAPEAAAAPEGDAAPEANAGPEAAATPEAAAAPEADTTQR
jgi:nicotinate-nucleotide--dimethylbenzimidazole phosphoribosyltransferase